jgi:dTDP-4-dehydrorhamnose reductase
MKILVLGDGLLGSEIVKQSGWDFISRKKNDIDFNNINSYKECLADYNQIFNCVAYTKVYDNEKYLHIQTNFKSVIDLVEYCNRANKKLIQISTDYIYSNSVENASEEDVPANCNNWYTYSKLLGDAYVQFMAKDYLLIRCEFKPRPYPYPKATIQIGNFDYVDTVASLIILLIKNNASGVYNVGTERKSMLELASQTRDVELWDKNPEETMPYDFTMNVDKMNNFLKEHNDTNIACDSDI